MAETLAIVGGRRNLIAEFATTHGYESLKEERLLAIQEFVWDKDVFVSLPTGFGKSLIYGLLTPVIGRIRGHAIATSVALIVSPLASLMIDQKSRFLPKGISAVNRSP